VKSPSRGDTILVSAGDGLYGGVLFRAAIEAHRMLWPIAARPMKIVAGTRFPDPEWQELTARANEIDGLEITRSVPCLRKEMAEARCSISHCGYNTALCAMGSQTPSLFIPSQGSHRKEQMVRAQRLVYWGAGRLLMPHHLNTASLTNEISQLLQFEPRKISFDMNGAANSVKLIERAMHVGGLGLASATTGLNLEN
jgi:predicted glycosyltransferase